MTRKSKDVARHEQEYWHVKKPNMEVIFLILVFSWIGAQMVVLRPEVSAIFPQEIGKMTFWVWVHLVEYTVSMLLSIVGFVAVACKVLPD